MTNRDRSVVAAATLAAAAQPAAWQRNFPNEVSLEATRPLSEADGELDVYFENGANPRRVPGFWAGGTNWRVRIAPPSEGDYLWRTDCLAQPSLHARTGSFQAGSYRGSNPLLKHGPIRIAASGRHFEHSDGTPFFFSPTTGNSLVPCATRTSSAGPRKIVSATATRRLRSPPDSTHGHDRVRPAQ